MQNGHERPSPRPAALAVRDVLEGIAAVEGAMGQRALVAAEVGTVGFPQRNAFGDAVTVEQGSALDMVERGAGRIAEGERVAIVAGAAGLGACREALRRIATERLPAVVHAIAPRGSPDALALADLGW